MLPMNRGWRFSPKVVEGDTSREFDDTAFTRIVIPHANKVLPWHSFDDKEYEFISADRNKGCRYGAGTYVKARAQFLALACGCGL